MADMGEVDEVEEAEEWSRAAFYSGPDFTGESCVVPADGNTYTLAATGLSKINSLKIFSVDGWPAVRVRLYAARPTGYNDRGTEGTDYKTFRADCADTGAWTGTAYLKVSAQRMADAALGEEASLGLEPERVIHEKIEA